MKAILKYTKTLFVLLSTIGGVFAFYQQITAATEYSLSLHLRSSEKVIENNSGAPALRVLFNGAEIRSLYVTKIELINSGKRALTRDFIYEPVQINVGKFSEILQVSPGNTNLSHTKNTITAKWDLFNPGESIGATIFSTGPINLATSHKIKEIRTIEYIDYVANPPAKEKLRSLSVLWVIFLVLSLVITIDALLLVKQDPKLGKIFGLVKALPEFGAIDKKSFLADLSAFYEDYYQSVPLALVPPKMLMEKVAEEIGSAEVISGHNLERVKNTVIEYVRFGNMYSIRSMNILFGPLLFGFCFIRVAMLLLF